MPGKHSKGLVRRSGLVLDLLLVLALLVPASQSPVLAEDRQPSISTKASGPGNPVTAALSPGSVQLAGRPLPPARPVAQQAQAEEPSAGTPWLRVMVDPPQALPGEVVTVTVQVVPDAPLADGRATGAIPRGLRLESLSGEGVRFEPGEGRWHWALAALEAGAIAQLVARLRIQEDAPDLMVARVDLRAGDLALSEVGLIRRTFPPAEVVIAPEGGELCSADGRVRAIFPAGAVSQTVRLTHRPLSVDLLPASRRGSR